METDDLSNETYNAIIVTADKFHDDLAVQFSLLAEDCSTDDEFLIQSEALIKEWMEDRDLEDVIVEVFIDEPPNVNGFSILLEKMLRNIDKVKQIPIGKRKFDF